MNLNPSDPDVETIFGRIKRLEINLQPDFQRGEVWSKQKKQRLIDSILRKWHVPPIHIVELKETAKQEVLDGQQRLVSIRDFIKGRFTVDGNTEPFDADIAKLNGMHFDDLPENWRRRFNKFTIRIFEITDYLPGEPGELFFRLNQTTNMSAAEARNAFYGPSRQQVKALVQKFAELKIEKEYIGFSNSRMAYDDIIAHLCYSLEVGSLTRKTTSTVLADKYRSQEPFNFEVIEKASHSIELLGNAREHIHTTVKFNKATLYSWLYFISSANGLREPEFNSQLLGSFLAYFEERRISGRTSSKATRPIVGEDIECNIEGRIIRAPFLQGIFNIYNDRSTARVADVTSVVSRDLAIWFMYLAFLTHRNIPYARQGIINKIIDSLQGISVDSFSDAENYMEIQITQDHDLTDETREDFMQ